MCDYDAISSMLYSASIYAYVLPLTSESTHKQQLKRWVHRGGPTPGGQG